MPTPDFVLELREHVGHAPLWLPGVTAVVVNPDRTQLLMVRRSDTGAWTPVTGIIDPGEEPARSAVREVREEAGVDCRPVRLADVRSLPRITYPNGDRAQYLDLCFLMEHTGGRPHPADDENTEAYFAPMDDLPPMNERFREQVTIALAEEPEARFRG